MFCHLRTWTLSNQTSKRPKKAKCRLSNAEEYYPTRSQFNGIQYPQKRKGQLTLTSGNFLEILFSSFAGHCLAEIAEYLLPFSFSEADGSHCSSWIAVTGTLLSTEVNCHISEVRANPQRKEVNIRHTQTQKHHQEMDHQVQMENQV